MVCRAGIKHHEQHPETHPPQQNFRVSLLSDKDHPLLLAYHWVVQCIQANDESVLYMWAGLSSMLHKAGTGGNCLDLKVSLLFLESMHSTLSAKM